MKKNCLAVFLFFSSFIFLFACNQERDPCLQPTTVPLRVHTFQAFTDSTANDTLLPHPLWIAIDSLKAVQFPEKTATFYILLSSVADSCRYALQPDSALASYDTITFFYARRLQFLSNACGYTYFYSLQNIVTTKHNIDSIKINNNDVNSNVNTPEHVQIFF